MQQPSIKNNVNFKKNVMKKKYLLIAVSAFVMAIIFSGCYVERYPHYHHHHTVITVINSVVAGSYNLAVKSKSLFLAVSFASSYPASACRITPIPGSFLRTRLSLAAAASLPSATITMPA